MSDININELEENEFILPVGYKDSEGRLHKTVKLSPINGMVEEAISSPKVRDNGGKLVTELIFGVVERIGAIKNVTRDIVRNLSTVDRDFIILKTRQISMGDDIEYMDICPNCKGKNTVNININELEVIEGNSENMTFDLYNGVKDGEGQCHKNITIQMPNGAVQEFVAPIARVNPAQATTAMLQAITVKIEGLGHLSANTFREMTKRDRDLILKKLGEFTAKVDLTVKVECADCGGEFTSVIPLSSLLGE